MSNKILPRSSAYISAHMWMYRHFGPANVCELDPLHTAKRYEWANLSGKYIRERSDWKSLCSPCHGQLDRRNSCKNGHLFSESNIYWYQRKDRPNPERGCRECRKEASNKARRKKCQKLNN